MSEMLLERHKKKSFLHQIATGDEKWIHYDNPKRKKSYMKPGQPAKSTAKPNIHGAKVMLCIWWDQKGVYATRHEAIIFHHDNARPHVAIPVTSEQGIKNRLDSFLAAKPAQFFWDGIDKLLERWEKVIASDGQYFE